MKETVLKLGLIVVVVSLWFVAIISMGEEPTLERHEVSRGEALYTYVKDEGIRPNDVEDIDILRAKTEGEDTYIEYRTLDENKNEIQRSWISMSYIDYLTEKYELEQY